MPLLFSSLPGHSLASGSGFVRQMFAAWRPDLLAVVVSAYAATETMEQAKSVGVKRVLSKPINFDGLISVIEETAGKPE